MTLLKISSSTYVGFKFLPDGTKTSKAKTDSQEPVVNSAASSKKEDESAKVKSTPK